MLAAGLRLTGLQKIKYLGLKLFFTLDFFMRVVAKVKPYKLNFQCIKSYEDLLTGLKMRAKPKSQFCAAGTNLCCGKTAHMDRGTGL